MGEESIVQQVIGGFAVALFIFSIAPVGFFVGLVPASAGVHSIVRISQTEYVFLRRVGVPEVIVTM